VKYYIYISDAKVDMLFAQVPHDIKKKVATEWKMDLKLLSASRRVETEGEDNRIARLETVVDFIRDYGNLGSVDEADEYVEDTLMLRWGYYGFHDENNPVVYFGGETEKTIVGLGGSTKHLIGNSGLSGAHSHSATPLVLNYLSKELGLPEGTSNPEWVPARIREIFTPIKAVELATRQMRGVQQNVDFMAKSLVYGPAKIYNHDPAHRGCDARSVLVATPLYVAMAG
jgi:hypothetical protein